MSDSDRLRPAILWICTLLFLLRVLGQIEVLLLAPSWLPPMDAWYSGLLPYPLLLPAQILVLMTMSVLTMATRELRSGAGRWRRIVRGFALCYFVIMLLRLIVQLLRGASDALAAGGIPIAFHWVLALYLLVLARPVQVGDTAGGTTIAPSSSLAEANA